jgi:hypothetical protein
VYEIPVQTEIELRQLIVHACETTHQTLGIFGRTLQSLLRRYQFCLEVWRRHFEQLL